MTKLYNLNDRLPLNKIFDDHNIKIYSCCSSGWHESFKNISKYFDKNTYIFGSDWGKTEKNTSLENPTFLTNMEFPENFCFMSNVYNTHLKRSENGFNSIFCNHNTFINENIFNIDLNIEKKYDLVINSRAKKWKRVHLAQNIDNIALIINRWNIENHYGENSDDYLKLNYSYLNNTRLTSKSVASIYNQSKCGGIFSEAEGACYSSSEMLLCGLPIISTPSFGGRDIYYDNYNSIIVEPNEIQIKYANEKLLREKKDPFIIRNNHLKIMKEHEITLIKKFEEIFNENHININAEEWYYQNKFNKDTNNNHFMKAEGKMIFINDIIF